jgi:hypothetical protein
VVAFASLGVQLAGLVGDHGILPAAAYFDAVDRHLGPGAWRRLPSLCWLVGAHTAMLQALATLGATCGLALLVDRLPVVAALTAWISYASLMAAGQVFLGFQWDALLLETGLLALAVAPQRWRAAGSAWTLVPLWCLVFKLHVLSGWVKLASHDPTWRDLTALTYHYWTTCLPVWTGWYAAQLPVAIQRASVACMFAVELAVPFAIWGPRRLRHLAAAAMIALQLAIAATGNYGFFNLLTIVLCLTLLDDAMCPGWWPGHAAPAPSRSLPRATVAVLLSTLVLLPMLSVVSDGRGVPSAATAVLDTLAPLRSFNTYGLFARMTTHRPEIVVEASDDGATWRALEFRWKPGALDRRPAFVAPYMPRLDWQMWFAALQGYQQTPWFDAFLGRLLEGRPDVTGLLAPSAAREPPPRWVRAVLYSYRFATPAERARGIWWRRERVGLYAPPRRG